jgi:hypothetical protein
MRRLTMGSALILAIAIATWGDVHAQGVGAPLQLTPGAAAAHTKIPPNWKIISSQPDPLTGETLRIAQTMPKTTPVIDGKSILTEFVVKCGIRSNGVERPFLSVRFASLAGVGHFKNFQARYRFDEGPVQVFTATSKLGKNHAREFMLDSGPPDPSVVIASATRLRMEFNFQSAGMTFLDFNVSGAAQALNALACPD